MNYDFNRLLDLRMLKIQYFIDFSITINKNNVDR